MAGEASSFGNEESFGGGDVDGRGGNGSLVVAHISEESAVFCPPALGGSEIVVPECVSRCATKGRTFGRQKRGRARSMRCVQKQRNVF